MRLLQIGIRPSARLRCNPVEIRSHSAPREADVVQRLCGTSYQKCQGLGQKLKF